MKRETDRLGVAYTPIEVVDYVLRSADRLSQHHFGKGLSDPDVHVLDPFTGTGTFINRLLTIGDSNGRPLVTDEDLDRKYTAEIPRQRNAAVGLLHRRRQNRRRTAPTPTHRRLPAIRRHRPLRHVQQPTRPATARHPVRQQPTGRATSRPTHRRHSREPALVHGTENRLRGQPQHRLPTTAGTPSATPTLHVPTLRTRTRCSILTSWRSGGPPTASATKASSRSSPPTRCSTATPNPDSEPA